MSDMIECKKATACNWKTMIPLEDDVDKKDMAEFIFIQLSRLSPILTCVQTSCSPMINVVQKTKSKSLKVSVYNFKIIRKFPSKNHYHSTLNKARKHPSNHGGE
jgi:hypothetical protein